MLIVGVAPNSPAAKHGLQRGDIIARIGQTKVTNPEEVASEVKRATEEEHMTVLLLIKRDGVSRFVAVPLEQAGRSRAGGAKPPVREFFSPAMVSFIKHLRVRSHAHTGHRGR